MMRNTLANILGVVVGMLIVRFGFIEIDKLTSGGVAFATKVLVFVAAINAAIIVKIVAIEILRKAGVGNAK